jgi:hypothetical protein
MRDTDDVAPMSENGLKRYKPNIRHDNIPINLHAHAVRASLRLMLRSAPLCLQLCRHGHSHLSELRMKTGICLRELSPLTPAHSSAMSSVVTVTMAARPRQ